MLLKLYKEWVKPLSQDAANIILDTLFPIHCIACGIEGLFVCRSCRVNLKRVDRQICIACKKPSPFGMTHPSCVTAHGVDGLISIFDYHDPVVAEAIIEGKYSFLPGLFNELGELVARAIDREHTHLLDDTNPFTLTPLPLHPSRLRWRGFNQAEVLAHQVSNTLGLLSTNLLVRPKSTKTQKDLKREQRLTNVDGAFKLAKQANVHGKNVIIIDDVTTTGATLLEAAKVLKRNGAEKVWCVTVARD